jgi:hypothetical protein
MEIMLLPYNNDPATGSRIPSISKGGAARKAVMEHQRAEPTNVETILRTGNPIGE